MKRIAWSLLLLFGCDGVVVGTDAGPIGTDAGPGIDDAGPPPGPAAVLYDPSGEFFDTPFPSDGRTDSRGHPDLTGFPRARGLVASGVALVADERPGFSPLTAVYFRFTGALDASALPSPADTREGASRVVLIDIDPESPERGRRLPAHVRFRAEPSAFWPANTLTVQPVAGFEMHVARTYAAVVLDGLRASDGSPVTRSDAFEALKGGSDAHHAALFDALEAVGVARADVLVASQVTTSDPARDMDLAREFVAAQELPEVRGWRLLGVSPRLATYEATFDTYELMDGEPPYMEFGSGLIRFDAEGSPRVVRRRAVRVGISVPTTPRPEGGYPIVLYGHGTGGDHASHLRDEGSHLGPIGLATIGLEAALHGQRNPAGFDVESLLVSNPVAAREIVRQTVIDMLVMYRMLRAGRFAIPASVTGADEVPFDVERMSYMGHSQGSQEGGVLLAIEPSIRAAFLSAAGESGLISVVDRELRPGTTIACLLAGIIMEDCAAITEDHPVLTQIVQPMLDPADPVAFAHRFVRERPTDWEPVSLAVTEGLLDTYTPPRGTEALAVSIGLPVVEPVARMGLPLELAGSPRVRAPVRDNGLSAGGAPVTLGLLQFPMDGHFAIYRNEDARRRYVEFFRTFLEDGAPTIVGPR
ncbi:MAG: hypothetical protein KF729_30340 [Sandaracinaceae bacterium]|nr:hypothetical protein [Sandaracinaceae bacterium]